MKIGAGILGIFLLALPAFELPAQDQAIRIGRETNLPIPRYISINSAQANMRRGPSLDYPIDWEYHRKGLPVKVIGESGHWRKVEDADGVKGWFHYALLSGKRTVLIEAERVAIGESPGQSAVIIVMLEKGVIANLKTCINEWCQIEVDRYEGWLPKNTVWGVEKDEIFD